MQITNTTARVIRKYVNMSSSIVRIPAAVVVVAEASVVGVTNFSTVLADEMVDEEPLDFVLLDVVLGGSAVELVEGTVGCGIINGRIPVLTAHWLTWSTTSMAFEGSQPIMQV